MTPDTDAPCGPADLSAFLLQPVHVNCGGCRTVILELSRGRTPMRGTPLRTMPRLGEDLHEGWNPDVKDTPRTFKRAVR